MGLSGSWIGFPKVAKERLLLELGFEETDQAGDFFALDSPFAFGEMPNGSFIIYSNDIDWADRTRLLHSSRLGLAVASLFSEIVMFSSCSAAQDGKELWHVSHDSSKGINHLEVTGEPPADFAEIRQRCIDEQDAEGGEKAGVDFLFDAPLQLAKLMCGLKYDDESSQIPFTGLRAIEGGWAAAQLPPAQAWRRRWLWLVFGALIVLALLVWLTH